MDALNIIRQIGSAEDMEKAAADNLDVESIPAFNTHIHLPPNFSAFQTVPEAVEQAAAENLKVLGAGNYYDFSVYESFAQGCWDKGIFPLFSTEIITLDEPLLQKAVRINDPGNPGKMYLCGKGISRWSALSPRGQELLQIVRRNDRVRMKEMIDRMSAHFAQCGVPIPLDDQVVIQRVVRRHRCDPQTVTLQERHVAQAFQEVFFEKVPPDQRIERLTALFGTSPKSKPDDAVGIQNEIRSYLMKAGKPCFVPEAFLSPAQAEELIAALGGVVCYPVLADGSNPVCEFEASPEQLVKALLERHYPMVEFISLRNSPDILRKYVQTIRQAGIAVTVGTEHNTLDKPPLTPTCLKGVPLPEDLKKIFWEGTCVLAAHQFLTVHGREGFAAWDPKADGKTRSARIEQFARLGAAVLKRYFQTVHQGLKRI